MRGGKRPGSGRKKIKIADKKCQLSIYIPNSIIEVLGKDFIREFCENAVAQEANKVLINK